MAKQFIKGNVYVFTKKNYIKSEGKKDYIKASKPWVDDMNGRIVIINNKSSGSIGQWRTAPGWCKCIKNNNSKIERERN
jgi:hypothetical protein